MKHSEKKRRSSRAVLFHLFIFLALGAFLLDPLPLLRADTCLECGAAA